MGPEPEMSNLLQGPAPLTYFPPVRPHTLKGSTASQNSETSQGTRIPTMYLYHNPAIGTQGWKALPPREATAQTTS